MLDFKIWLVNRVTTDATIQSLLGASSASDVPFFPLDIDITPEDFPCITYSTITNTVWSRPQGIHEGTIQIDVWSKTNALEVENLYERLDYLLNFKDSTTQSITGTMWWIREQMERDMHDAQRRVWHKSVDYRFWVSRTNNT